MRHIAIAGIIWISAAIPPAVQSQSPLNVVFILVDDLGWTDVGFMGSDFYETPNIDALAASGVRFTNAYAATTVCSPTRASILTGKYPARLRVTDWIHGHSRPWARLRVPDWTHRLRPEETTIAEVLARVGYDTVTIGKWHLGHDSPEVHGFDANIAGTDRGQPPSYYAPYNIPTLPEGSDGEYLTDRLTSEAVEFIEQHRDRSFFLYLPYYTVHTPIEPKADKLEKYAAKEPGDAHKNPGYAAMIESLDEGVGRILSSLERLDLDDETVVIFTSDNGGLVLDLSDWGPLQTTFLCARAKDRATKVAYGYLWQSGGRESPSRDVSSMCPSSAPTFSRRSWTWSGSARRQPRTSTAKAWRHFCAVAQHWSARRYSGTTRITILAARPPTEPFAKVISSSSSSTRTSTSSCTT